MVCDASTETSTAYYLLLTASLSLLEVYLDFLYDDNDSKTAKLPVIAYNHVNAGTPFLFFIYTPCDYELKGPKCSLCKYFKFIIILWKYPLNESYSWHCAVFFLIEISLWKKYFINKTGLNSYYTPLTWETCNTRKTNVNHNRTNEIKTKHTYDNI